MQRDRGLHEQLQFTWDLLQGVPAQHDITGSSFLLKANFTLNSEKDHGKNLAIDHPTGRCYTSAPRDE